MAYTPADPNDPNNLQPGNPNNPMNQVPQTASGIGSGASGVSGPQGAVSVPTSTKAPPFTDLGAYLRANQPQVQDMAGKVAANVTQDVNQVNTDINAGQQGFESAIKSGSVQFNPDLVNRAVSAPSSFVSNPDDVAAFNAQRDAAYKGPTDFQSSDIYSKLSDTVAKAAAKAPNASNSNDFAPFVSALEHNPTPGMTALDNLLLQESPEAATSINTARQPYSAFPAALDTLLKGENTNIGTAQAETAGVAPAVSTALTGANDAFTKALQAELDAATGAQGLYNKDVGQIRGTAQDINAQILDFLRANPQLTLTGNNDYLAPWLNLREMSTAPSMDTVASSGDYKNAEALNLLAGSTVPLNLPISGATESQAGSFALPQDLEAAITGGAVPSAMQNELQAFSDQIQNAYHPYQALMDQEMSRADMVTQASDLHRQMGVLNRSKPPTQINDPITNVASPNPAYADWQSQMTALQNKYQTITTDPNYSINNYWPQIGQMAQGLQWLPQASTQYNDLIAKLQADLGPLSDLNIPVPATPGSDNTLSTLKTAGLANPVTTMPTAAALAGNQLYKNFSQDNIGQLGLTTATLGLGTLFLKPEIVQSIGDGISKVLDTIGNFFGGLF